MRKLTDLKGRETLSILFVYPENPRETYWGFQHTLKIIGKRSVFPPLGLLTISPMLPSSWKRKLIDQNVEELRDADILEADIVCASTMIVQQKSLRQLIDRCKRLDRPVIVGGPFPSTGLEHVKDADCIFIGEAENTLPEFINDLRLGIPKHVYRNPVNGKGKEIMPSVHLTPVPDWGLLRSCFYESMNIQYSRGCPFSCEFCDIIEIYGRVPRYKTPQQMIAELDALYENNWRGSVFIVDDNFIGNKKAVKEELLPALCRWMENHNYPFSFTTEASLNLAADKELLRLMRRAGFHKVFIGIETPVAESLKEAQKGQNRGDMLQAVRTIQNYGLEVTAGFIIGFDNDPPDIFQRQVQFIKESAIPLAMVGLLQALPNTQLWRRLANEGRLPKTESTGDNTDGTMNFVPIMDRKIIGAGYKRVMKTIYKPRAYYARVLENLRRTRAAGPSPNFFTAKEATTIGIRVILKLGLLDRHLFVFWWYFLKVAWQRFDLLPDFMSYAVMGYHQTKLTSRL